MTNGESVPNFGANGGEHDGLRPDDTPTPVTGIPVQQPAGMDDMTPPAGMDGLTEVVTAEDFGHAGPAVFGAESHETPQDRAADDWPKLEYRSRNKPERRGGMFDALRRRNGDQP